MPSVLNFSKTGIIALAGVMELPFVAGQVVLAPSTITEAVTLFVGSPATAFTLSVVRTGMVTIDTPSVNSSPTMPPSSVISTVFVTDSAADSTTQVALEQPFSLPTQQAVITQAPCVSACLQEGLIASAAGTCALTAGTVIDNACACLSAPYVALYALSNCASAACTGVAAGPAGLPLDLAAVTSLYNDYCVAAVGAEALSSAVASGQAVQASAAAGSSSTDTAGAEGSADTPTAWSTGPSTNGTLTANATLSTNGTFDGGATLTAAPTAVDPGITTGLVASTSTSSVDAATTGTKSEACLELTHKSERLVPALAFGSVELCLLTDLRTSRAILSLVFALTVPLFIL